MLAGATGTHSVLCVHDTPKYQANDGRFDLQATVHPFLCYFKNSEGKVESICFTIISENKKHDTISVHF